MKNKSSKIYIRNRNELRLNFRKKYFAVKFAEVAIAFFNQLTANFKKQLPEAERAFHIFFTVNMKARDA